ANATEGACYEAGHPLCTDVRLSPSSPSSSSSASSSRSSHLPSSHSHSRTRSRTSSYTGGHSTTSRRSKQGGMSTQRQRQQREMREVEEEKEEDDEEERVGQHEWERRAVQEEVGEGRVGRHLMRYGGGPEESEVGELSRGGMGEAEEEEEGSAGSAGFNMRVVLNPFLSPDTGRVSSVNNRWVKKLRRWRTGILVLSRTARYKSKRTLLRELRATLKAVRQRHPNLLIIWRNSPAPHDDCDDATLPLRRRPLASSSRHREMNEIVKPLLE
ncbi:unnamed protein product, partial [Closterium sp. NIES-54]